MVGGMNDDVSNLLNPNEVILWKKIKKKRTYYKRFCILTNKRWLQKENSVFNEFLYGVLLNADGIMRIDLQDINVVRTYKTSKETYSIGFFFFYEENWGSSVPLLGVIVNAIDYNELFHILVEKFQLETHVEEFPDDKITWYFRHGYDYRKQTKENLL